MEFDDGAPLAQSFKLKRKPIRKKKKQFEAQPEEPPEPAHDPDPAAVNPLPEIELDYSVENHFKAVDKIAKLCGYSDSLDANQPEIKRLSNSITFLREWRDFRYAPRSVMFANQHNLKEKDVAGEVTLHQFSSASVAKKEMGNGDEAGTEASKDYVMYVGGSVWALDWCPRDDQNSDTHIKSEFVAVAAHPPESSYHKIGAPLTGRGTIQIWCLLTVYMKGDVPNPRNKKSRRNPELAVKSNDPTEPPKPRGRPRKEPLNESVPRKPLGRPRKKPLDDPLPPSPLPPRPRGRPRKKPRNDSVKKIDTAEQYVQPLAIEYPMSSDRLHSSDGPSLIYHEHTYDEDSVDTNKASSSNQIDNSNLLLLTAPKVKAKKAKAKKKDQARDNNALHIPRQCEHGESASLSLDSMSPDKNIACIRACDANIPQIPIDVELPRLVLCLAHNGKVAWDVKWRPVNARHLESMHVMGYLAVLLGNGVLEVWEVPLPHTVKLVFPTSQEHIDPRFMKLKPVFRSSKLICGDKQSIPLTMEWSVSSLGDMILAGCHDGVVALWKFTVTDQLTETRPLLCFSAETGPIRTLAWAPIQSNPETANVFATAGQKGLKLWDIRDPFRPLREYPIQGGIFGLAWLPHLRCLLGVIDDGTLWSLNLEKTASDIPVSGKSLTVTSRPGLSSFDCSSFSIWCAVAYCGEDGKTFCFLPNSRSTKDPRRAGVYHYLCGSLLEEGPALVVASPSTNSSLSEKFPSMKKSRPKEEENTRVNQKIGQGCDNTIESISKQSEEVEKFPEKIVAMHRVSWNVNKGSYRWLCYGGAAGLVRCQKIDFFE
ncbi:hypothetical protein CASFOL_027375 [Castilleja foliolosa]|uniref:Transducin/WD40 repeat-like superfamily protein n=1 Tax=Castilleja foliolosa TaxID=1961234 RepID=A0ABD3CG78_9LAMI